MLCSRVELKPKFYFYHLRGGGRDVHCMPQVYMEDSLNIKQPRVRFHLWQMGTLVMSEFFLEVWKCLWSRTHI